jgi:succinate dehydrogenase / fumarate reductase membrane anchor subunit
MIDRATISNPRTHYGNGKKATKGFIWQRATGALNILFTLFIVWFVLAMAGAADAAARIALLRNPLVAIGLILLFVNVTIHMRIGMLDVIEDYVDHGPRNNLATAANTIFAVLVAAVAILSIVKLVFWG